MSQPSIQTRLNTRLASGIAAYVVVFAAVLGLLFVHGLTREFDRALVNKAQGIVEIARQELAETDGNESIPEFEGMELGHFAIWLSDGTLIGQPDSLAVLDVVVEKELADKPRFANLRLPDGRHGRKVEIDFVPRNQPGKPMLPSQVAIGSGVRTATLVVAEPRGSLNGQILRAALLVIAACAVLLGSLMLLIRSSLRRGLEPVVGLRRQVELINADGRSRRISLRDPPEELAPVLQHINRLQRSVDDSPSDVEAPAAHGAAKAS